MYRIEGKEDREMLLQLYKVYKLVQFKVDILNMNMLDLLK